MVKVFFGCSMRGGYNILSREKLEKITALLEENGYVLATKHQVQPNIVDEENKLEKQQIHDREYGRMLESDIGIFEVSNHSLGVGSEISDMIAMGKPVLCLYKKDLYNIVSAQLLGKKGSEFVKSSYDIVPYEKVSEIVDIVNDFSRKYIN